MRAVLPARLRRQPGVIVDPRAGRCGGQAPRRRQVADIGCGHGASTILLARAYPDSAFTGSDYHDQSIEIARKRAADAGVAGRVTFEVAASDAFSGTGY